MTVTAPDVNCPNCKTGHTFTFLAWALWNPLVMISRCEDCGKPFQTTLPEGTR